MRQAGTLNNEREAQRFAAWLVSQRIEAHAEQEGDGWAIWIRDEDHLPRAREEFERFRTSPQDVKYRDAERTAQSVLREEEARRKKALDNVVEMRGRWARSGVGGAAPRRCPLVLALIGVSILVFLATYNSSFSTVERTLLFFDPVPQMRAQVDVAEFDHWANLRRGEAWRLVTPMLLHFDVFHIAFNMLVLFSFGGQVEDRRGSAFLAVLIIVLAVASNAAQAWEMSLRGNPAGFGGMSGVNYGLFGYLLMKVKFDNREGYFLAPTTTFILLAWFFLCIGGQFPPLNQILPEALTNVANSAHAAGFFLGLALGYAPLLLRRAA